MSRRRIRKFYTCPKCGKHTETNSKLTIDKCIYCHKKSNYHGKKAGFKKVYMDRTLALIENGVR